MASDFVELDPVTKKPLQQAAQGQQQQGQQQQPGDFFDVEKFAADSATRQMTYAYTHGMRPTQQDYEDARKAAYQQGFETIRQMQLEGIRSQAEFGRQKEMRSYTEFGPRSMSPEQSKAAEGLMAAHNQIMMLYHQNADIPANDPYRKAATGTVAADWGQAVDPAIRLYEATRGGSVISLGRGLLEDTGQVAGKEEAQTLIKKLMPGPGDSPLMSARKTADMIQMEMNGIKAQMDSLPQGVDPRQFQNAYATAYADYSQIVNQYGSDSQKNFAPASPQQLWGKDAPPGSESIPIVKPVQPAVQTSFTQGTTDTLNAQASGKPPIEGSDFTEVDPVTKKPLGGNVWSPMPRPPLNPPSGTGAGDPIAAAAQQAGQYAGGSDVRTSVAQPSDAQLAAATTPQKDQMTVFQRLAKNLPLAAGAAGKDIGATLNWLFPSQQQTLDNPTYPSQ